MPELPEVETIRVGLSRLLKDEIVSNVSSDNDKSFPNNAEDVNQFLIGSKVLKVKRRAKVLIIEFSSKYSLMIHLKMTGQLVFASRDVHFGAGHPNDSLIKPLPDKSTRVTIEFKNADKLFFNDQRKFGWMRLMPTAEIPNVNFFQKIGPEPLDSKFNWQVLRDRLKRRSNTTIKAALLDQTVLAGIGNIYADESLWGAKIHPSSKVKDLSATDIKKLYESIVSVLRLAIEKGGSTDRNYVDATGKRGAYLNFAKVFRRQGQPCLRCGNTIEKIRVAGRGTHVCPNCQKLL